MSKSKLDELLERVEQNNWDDEHTRKLAAIVRVLFKGSRQAMLSNAYEDEGFFNCAIERELKMALARAEQIAGGTDETR